MLTFWQISKSADSKVALLLPDNKVNLPGWRMAIKWSCQQKLAPQYFRVA